MNKKLIFLIAAIMYIFFYNCKQSIKKETILDKITHIEDSILKVPEIAKLCDKIESIKQKINIGDCNLFCEIEGEGTPLVLVNGGPGGTHHCFHPWFSELKKKFKIIYYDQRGTGQSDYKAGDGYSFEQTIDDLDNLRKALKIDKWFVLGHSYGGGIVQFYSIKYPERVLGQILIGSITMMPDGKYSESREFEYSSENEIKKQKELDSLINAGKLNFKQYYYNYLLNGGWKRQNFHKPDADLMAHTAVNDIVFDEAFNSDFYLYNFEKAFHNCPLPTLVCEGKYDLIWKAEKADVIKKNHPNAKFVFFENSSHNIYFDETDNLINTINKWVDSVKCAENSNLSEWKNYTEQHVGGQISLIRNSRNFCAMIKKEGMTNAKKYLEKFKKENHKAKLFIEASMNGLGYEYLVAKKFNEAIEIYRLNCEEYPESSKAFDRLGRAYMQAGNKALAIEVYEKALKLNPENKAAIDALKKLK